MKSAQIIYSRIKDQASEGKKLIVFFDLDSTLFNVSYRSQVILDKFCALDEYQKQFPEVIEKLRGFKVIYRDWGVLGALKRSQIQAPIDFFEAANSFWRKHFFDNDHMKYDRLYPGALEYVKKIVELPLKVAYLTGRNRVYMGRGTELSLKQHGFPLDEQGVELYMKPQKGLKDDHYKGGVIKEVQKGYDEIWIFDNEPVILSYIEEHYPGVHLVFMDTVHSAKSEPQSHWLSIPGADFRF